MGVVEGKFLGLGKKRKFRVEWTSFHPHVIGEYGAQHSIFKNDQDTFLPKRARLNDMSKVLSTPDEIDEREESDATEESSDDTEQSSDEMEEVSQERDFSGEDNCVTVGNRVWRPDPALDVVDPRNIADTFSVIPRLKWPPKTCEVTTHTEIDYFSLMFPRELKSLIITATNSVLGDKTNHVDEHIVDHFIGSLLGMSVQPSSSIAHYWNEKDVGFITGQKFAIKTGLRKNCWEQIRGALTFRESNAEVEEKTDEWYRIRQLFKHFNDNMNRIFIAGSTLTIDESMSRWLGDEHYVPGITKMKLKPEGVGFLIKNMSDSQSKVILHIELQEKPENMALKKYYSERKMKTTAVTQRLTEHYHGTKRCVIGDGWFSSVKTAEAMQACGLNFVGIVKNATAGFPKQWIQEHAFGLNSKRGDVVSLHSVDEHGRRLIAHAWNEPGKASANVNKRMKMFISTFGTSLPEAPWKRLRKICNDAGQIQGVFMDVPQSNIVKCYFEAANSIDIHNHYRQYLLRLEEIWQTKDWWVRIFQTVLGMIVVNSFLAFIFFSENESKPTLKEFVNALAVALCMSGKQSDIVLRCRQRPYNEVSEFSLPDHCPLLIRGSGYGTASMMGRCKVVTDTGKACGQKAYFFCKTCSVLGENEALFYMCGPSTGRHCAAKHAAALF